MRVLVNCHSPAYETLGGAEKSIIAIAERWRERDPEVEFVFVVPATDGLLAPALISRGFAVTRIPSFPWVLRKAPDEGERILRYQRQNAQALQRFTDLIAREKVDLVVTNTIVNPWAAVAASVTGTPHAWLVREFGDLDHGLEFEFGAEPTWRDIATLSDVVVANSEAVRDHIESFAPGTRAVVSYPPVAVPADAAPDAAEDNAPSADVALAIVCVGTISVSKGQAVAIEAVQRLASAGVEAQLTLVGADAPTGYRDELRNLADRLGVGDRVTILPPTDDVASIVAKGHIAVTPSTMEAFGRTTLEYMLLGKPVVGARSGGTVELIDSGRTGYLFTPGNPDDLAVALAVYANDRTAIARHGARARERALGFVSGDRAIDALIDRLGALGGGGRTSGRTPLLLGGVMSESGRALDWVRARVHQRAETLEYRLGSRVVGPGRRLVNLGRRARRGAERVLRAESERRSRRSSPAPGAPSQVVAPGAAKQPRPMTTLVKDQAVALALVRRGLVDKDFYGVLAGKRFATDLDAARHFLSTGLAAGLAPSADFEPEWAGAVSGKPAAAAVRYVAGHGGDSLARVWTDAMHEDSTAMVPSTTVDPDALLAAPIDGSGFTDPRSLYERPGRFIATTLTRQPSNAVTGTRWDAALAACAQRSDDVVSILMLTYNDWRRTVAAVDSIFAARTKTAYEIVLVDNGSAPPVRRILRALYGANPLVNLIVSPVNLNFAGGCNLAFTQSVGSRVVFLNNDTEVTDGWLDALLATLDEPDTVGAQSLLIYGHGTIQTAGTVFDGPNTLPRHFLTDHPIEDALALSKDALSGFSAATAASLAVRSADFARVQGFDELFANGMEDVDLCLRLGEEIGGAFTTSTGSRVKHHESVSQGRGARTVPNRARFWQRWAGSLPVSDAWRYAELGLATVSFAPRGTRPGEIGLTQGTEPVTVRQPDAPRRRVAIRRPYLSPTDGRTEARAQLVEEVIAALGRLDAHLIVDTASTRYRRTRAFDDAVVHFAFDGEPDIQPGAKNVVIAVGAAFDDQFARFGDVVLRLTDSADEPADLSGLLTEEEAERLREALA
ncbi:MAG: glycosyltransferase [Leifsonia sp.]|uniref:glycosyltransferase n=1 Tax=Leifsonia sp. TaxID=1870902 RepID=UPI003F7EFE8F